MRRLLCLNAHIFVKASGGQCFCRITIDQHFALEKRQDFLITQTVHCIFTANGVDAVKGKIPFSRERNTVNSQIFTPGIRRRDIGRPVGDSVPLAFAGTDRNPDTGSFASVDQRIEHRIEFGIFRQNISVFATDDYSRTAAVDKPEFGTVESVEDRRSFFGMETDGGFAEKRMGERIALIKHRFHIAVIFAVSLSLEDVGSKIAGGLFHIVGIAYSHDRAGLIFGSKRAGSVLIEEVFSARHAAAAGDGGIDRIDSFAQQSGDPVDGIFAEFVKVAIEFAVDIGFTDRLAVLFRSETGSVAAVVFGSVQFAEALNASRPGTDIVVSENEERLLFGDHSANSSDIVGESGIKRTETGGSTFLFTVMSDDSRPRFAFDFGADNVSENTLDQHSALDAGFNRKQIAEFAETCRETFRFDHRIGALRMKRKAVQYPGNSGSAVELKDVLRRLFLPAGIVGDDVKKFKIVHTVSPKLSKNITI